jgi:glutamyl/glutaminyl-tRNA synthetase
LDPFLFQAGRAYRCFCTPSELDAIRISLKASGSLDTYDRRGLLLTDEEVHRKMKAGEKYVVRLKVSFSLSPCLFFSAQSLDFSFSPFSLLRKQTADDLYN